MKCERSLFGHGSKPDGKVWVTAAMGNGVINTHTSLVCVCVCMRVCTHTSESDCQSMFLLGVGLMLHWCPNAVSFQAESPAVDRSWE